MPTSNIRFGLLGCGRVANRYVDVFNHEVVGGTVVACVDLIVDRAKSVSNRLLSVPQFSDDFELFSRVGVDVILILTESGNHFVDSRRCLEAGFNVVIEKPVALLPKQAEEVEALAGASGLFCSVVKQNRYNPAVIKTREALVQGRFGRIVTSSIRLRWCRYQDYYNDGWHGTWRLDGGVIAQQAIHHIDLLNNFCGPVVRLCASMTRRVNKLECEDTSVAILEFSDGSLGTIEATTAARPADIEASLSIIGDRGAVEISGVALNEIKQWNFVDFIPGDATVASDFSQAVPSAYGLGHGPYIQEVIDRLTSGLRVAIIRPTEAAKALKLVHAMYASVERDGWIELDSEITSSRLGRQ